MGEFSQLHYVNVGPHGTFRKSGQLKSEPEHIDSLFQHLTNTGTQRLVVFFHGGLVKEGMGLKIAEKMWGVFKDHAHPVTFVWETGFLETLTQRLNSIYQTQLFQRMMRFILRQATKRLASAFGGRGHGEGMTIGEIEAELQQPVCFRGLDEGARGEARNFTEEDLPRLQSDIQVEFEVELDADPDLQTIIREEVTETKELNPEVAVEINPSGGKGIINLALLAKKMAEVVIEVAKRFMRQRDHGFYPTVVEEILRSLYIADFGAWVWRGIKDRATEMWEANGPFLDEDSHIGTYFLEKLSAWKQVRPGAIIDLVGHSAGSIAICHLLEATAGRHPELTFRNLAFLAPACTVQLFFEQVVSHRERFSSFRMFTMSDALETADHLVPLVYPRSLLYLISGVLEKEADEPLAGMEVHTRGAKPYDTHVLIEVSRFLRETGKNRLVLSRTEGADPGLNSASQRHGDFDDDRQTQESLQAIIGG
ncbi:MAG TPA: hypothetical protein VEF34_17025 [Syntrophobacteraceae bacterium]|nr:hypothetical protein [Syntrophobacteraceae bacterium]